MPDDPAFAHHTSSEATDAFEDHDGQPFGDLSEAAREAVRQPADPRIDAHLASLGLADDGPAAAAGGPIPAGRVRPSTARSRPAAATAPDVEELRASVVRLEAALVAVTRALRVVAWGLVAVAVVAVLAVLLALR